MISTAKRPITEKEMQNLLQSGIDFPPLVFNDVHLNPSFGRKSAEADAVINASFENLKLKFLTEIQVASTPKLVQATAAKLALTAYSQKMHPLLVIPYLSDENAQLLQSSKVNTIDLCGNGFIHVEGRLLIARSGKPNQFRQEYNIHNTFRGNSAIAARAFLIQSQFASLNELHAFILKHNSSITLSTVSKVVKKLEHYLVISKEERRLTLLQPDMLLDLLSVNYRTPKIVRHWRGKLGEQSSKFWRKLGTASKIGFAKICRTGRSSAEEYATIAEDSLRSYYIDVPPQELLDFCQVSDEETNRFPDLELIQVEEHWPFFDMRKAENCFMASPVETYLELSKGDKRQQQTAKQIEQMILKDLDFSRS